jgi:predicted dehydrogenase
MAADHVTRLALVGYGRIAPKHLEAFRAMGAEFVAACNRSVEGRARAEREGGIPRTYAAIDEMLDRERPDGVVCCASMPQMYAAAVELLNAGVPALLEKPPGTSLDEFRHLCELAENNRALAMIGLNRRHYSVVRKALEDCGGPEAVTAVFVEWSEDPRHLLARGFSADEISRMVFGNSLHGLDLLVHLAGSLDAPAVVGRNLGEPLRWMMALQGVSRRGAIAAFNSTWDSPGRWRVSFCSPGRRYLFAPLECCQVSEAGKKEPRTIEPDQLDARFKPGFYAQAEVFLRAVTAGEVPPQYNLASAGPAMRLADALSRACQSSGSMRAS